MNDYLKKLIQIYSLKGLLIDTNLLLLYIVGSFNIELIGNFKRTAQFTTDDFDLVSDFLSLFVKKITTPHILTEVSNLIGNKQEFQGLLKIFIETTAEEKFPESQKVVQNKEFIKFGLTDTAIIETAKDSYLVFTNDQPLYGFLINAQIDVVSLDQLKMVQAT